MTATPECRSAARVAGRAVPGSLGGVVGGPALGRRGPLCVVSAAEILGSAPGRPFGVGPAVAAAALGTGIVMRRRALAEFWSSGVIAATLLFVPTGVFFCGFRMAYGPLDGRLHGEGGWVIVTAGLVAFLVTMMLMKRRARREQAQGSR